MLGGKKKETQNPGDGGTTAWEEKPSATPAKTKPVVTTTASPAASTGSRASTFIAKGSEFVGKLTFEGTVRIDGRVQGEIFSKGTLIIGPGADIKASICVDTCQIMGTVHGNVHAKKRLELAKPGRLIGDIRTPTLVLEAGVVFEGQCRMENLEGAAKQTMPTPEKRAVQ